MRFLVGLLVFWSQLAGAIELKDAVVGHEYFVDVLNFTFLKDSKGNQIAGIERNDKVQLLSVVNGKNPQGEVKVISTKQKVNLSRNYFISLSVLNPNPSQKYSLPDPDSKYIIIQNIASERLRLYERCIGDCPNGHKMIFETQMAVGDEDKGRTWLGTFFIREWVKFYQDSNMYYPSWYDPKYPKIPKPPSFDWFGRYVMKWASDEWLPLSKSGKPIGHMRGAFGWYTALMGPDVNALHNSQWTHGTFGWGEEGDKYIKGAKGVFANMFADPRSSGCSRLPNPAIAYLQSLAPVGTPLYKIYAIEGTRNTPEKLKELYPEDSKTWKYILTTDFVRDNPDYSSDESQVPATAKVLEKGSYKIILRPKAIARDRAGGGDFYNKTNDVGDIYSVGGDRLTEDEYRKLGRRIDDGAFRGVFLVDEGLLVNYEHPKHENIYVGGIKDPLPEELQSSDENYEIPEPIYYVEPQQNMN